MMNDYARRARAVMEAKLRLAERLEVPVWGLTVHFYLLTNAAWPRVKIDLISTQLPIMPPTPLRYGRRKKDRRDEWLGTFRRRLGFLSGASATLVVELTDGISAALVAEHAGWRFGAQGEKLK